MPISNPRPNQEFINESIANWYEQNITPDTPIAYYTQEPDTNFYPIWISDFDHIPFSRRIFSGRWVTLQEYSWDFWSPTSGISAGQTYGFPIDSSYDYLITKVEHSFILGSGTIDATANFWRIIWSLQPSASNFVDYRITANNNGATVISKPNTILEVPQDSRILLQYNRTGSPPTARIATSVKYRRVRK